MDGGLKCRKCFRRLVAVVHQVGRDVASKFLHAHMLRAAAALTPPQTATDTTNCAHWLTGAPPRQNVCISNEEVKGKQCARCAWTL